MNHCIWYPISSIFLSFHHSISNKKYIICEHVLPEVSILKSEFFRNIEAKSKIKDNKLMIILILWIGPNENISRMRIAMNKSTHKYLLSKSSDELIHYLFLVKIILFHFLCIRNFESINPLRYHNSFSWVLWKNLRDIQLWSFFCY